MRKIIKNVLRFKPKFFLSYVKSTVKKMYPWILVVSFWSFSLQKNSEKRKELDENEEIRKCKEHHVGDKEDTAGIYHHHRFPAVCGKQIFLNLAARNLIYLCYWWRLMSDFRLEGKTTITKKKKTGSGSVLLKSIVNLNKHKCEHSKHLL